MKERKQKKKQNIKQLTLSPVVSTPSTPVSTNSMSPAVKKIYTKEDFDFGALLGEGAYSRVVLSTFKTTGRRYATKMILKQQIISQNKVKTVKMEKEVLNKMNHPNIIKLFCTYQDKEYLYFALEWAPGGELFSYLSRYGAFSLEATIFYTAEIVNALEYMHSLNIIHRDLKPENILLSKDMHTKITDFGTAKILSEDDDADNIAEQASKAMTPRSRQTFCGTAEYISPEVLKNEKATKATDLWALGCIIYQLLTGDHPFKGDSEYLIFKKILSKELEIPSNIPEVAKDLVENLLKLDPDERLGARPGGYAELKRHPFFNGIDFNKLNETIPPRIIPHRVVSKQPVKTDRSGGNHSSNQTEYDKLLLKNEKILYISTVIKRSMMSSKTRALILTDKPRFFYVDVKTKEIKGYIPISKELSIIKKSEKEFLIHTPKRDFDIELVNGTIAGWEKVISSCVSK